MHLENWPKFTVGNYTIYLAATPEQKRIGLQAVKRLPDKHLVLFKDIPSGQYFHTVNCLFPIDILSLSSEYRVLDIWSMKPNQKLIGPTPPKTVSVLEGPAGWAAKNNITVGTPLLEALRNG